MTIFSFKNKNQLQKIHLKKKSLYQKLILIKKKLIFVL